MARIRGPGCYRFLYLIKPGCAPLRRRAPGSAVGADPAFGPLRPRCAYARPCANAAGCYALITAHTSPVKSCLRRGAQAPRWRGAVRECRRSGGVRGGSHPACHRPRQSRADAAHGVQVVRTVARSTWTPWTTPAPRSVGRRQTGWELRRVVGRRGETRTCSANNQSSSSDDEPRRTENTKTAISVRMTRTATSPCVGGRRNLPARGHHAATAVMTEGCWSLGSLSPWESPQLWLSAPGLSTRYPSQSTKSTAPSFTLVERGARTYRGSCVRFPER
jgi:hypothetical protein